MSGFLPSPDDSNGSKYQLQSTSVSDVEESNIPPFFSLSSWPDRSRIKQEKVYPESVSDVHRNKKVSFFPAAELREQAYRLPVSYDKETNYKIFLFTLQAVRPKQRRVDLPDTSFPVHYRQSDQNREEWIYPILHFLAVESPL
jgi:hypothetical protein